VSELAIFDATQGMHHRFLMLVYAVVDDSLSPMSPLGDSLDVYVRCEETERFIEDIRGDEPELAKSLRIEEREPRWARGTSEIRQRGLRRSQRAHRRR
jgi:hypothetical protein